MLKIKIDFKSFLRRGIKNVKEDFEISLINGPQGSGKSYLGIYKIESQFKGRKVYTNIQSYRTNTVEVEYFTKLEEIYNNHDINCVFLVDEVSKKFTKDSKIDKAFYSWLMQSRKHNRHVFLITQEYYEVPNWLRGACKTAYTTRSIPLTPIMITTLGYPVLTEDYTWSLNEIGMLIYKRNKNIANLYDTYEIIDEL